MEQCIIQIRSCIYLPHTDKSTAFGRVIYRKYDWLDVRFHRQHPNTPWSPSQRGLCVLIVVGVVGFGLAVGWWFMVSILWFLVGVLANEGAVFVELAGVNVAVLGQTFVVVVHLQACVQGCTASLHRSLFTENDPNISQRQNKITVQSSSKSNRIQNCPTQILISIWESQYHKTVWNLKYISEFRSGLATRLK